MEKFTADSSKVLELAKTLAAEYDGTMESFHILIALVGVKSSYACEMLTRLGFTTEIAESFLVKSDYQGGFVSVGNIASRIIDYAVTVSKDLGYDKVDTQHLLLGVCYYKNSLGAKILSRYNIDYSKIATIVGAMSYNKIGKSNIKIEKVAVATDSLDNITVLSENGFDVNERVKKHKEDFVGREKELTRLIQILSLRKKNNPMIIGDAGVGKTALVFGLAEKINQNSVPKFLADKRIYCLNTANLVSGTRYRGDMEEKVSKVFSELKSHNAIIFIDEIHTVTGNSGENGQSIANLIKPYLSSGDFSFIGATTIGEYRKFIEADPALERRFMTIQLNEPDKESTIRILKGLKPQLENHYCVSISDEALFAAVNLSEKYLPDRFFPDKAIDVIDEACGRKFGDKRFDNKSELKIDDIKSAIEDKTSLPVTEKNDEESEKLLRMEEEINKRIIGQEQAIAAISRTVKRAGAGLKPSKKPIGSFMFLGGTGVGKTETAKVLAEYLFGSENALIRFDMSEYMEKNSASKLIGSPPGYVGYDEGGALTEAVRRRPYSVILFDEIEKADTEVFNLLLQVLDDGRLTDNKGRTIDFRHTIIIMTGNIGAEKTVYSNAVGFGGNSLKDDESRRKDIIVQELKKVMRPEFINRIDNIIIFNELNKESLVSIANLILKNLSELLYAEKGIKLYVEEEVVNYLTDASFDVLYGARPLQRIIDTELADKLSEEILRNKLQNTDIDVKLSNNELIFINQGG